MPFTFTFAPPKKLLFPFGKNPLKSLLIILALLGCIFITILLMVALVKVVSLISVKSKTF